MRRAVTTRLGSLPSYRLGEESYDSTKLGLGKLMVQRTGDGNEDKFAGPLPISALWRHGELTAKSLSYPWAMQWSDSPTSKIDWVFLADTDSAAATRRIYCATFNRLTGEWQPRGFVTLTYPTTTAHTIRGFRMVYEKYTTGTVAVSGTAVTGLGTTWSASGLAVGSRIGFGSTDPSAISTWYEISAIGSDTSITLTGSAGTISSGTPYVIEDLRCVTATTNATAANGGLYLTKGLSFDIFTVGGTTVPAATTADNIRAVYWLKSAATEVNTTANGAPIEDKVDWQTQYVWVGNGTTTQQYFKHNIRAALTLTSGAATNQFVLNTAVSATLTGTATQGNNGRVAITASGPGAGQACIYFTTTTRVYRTKPLSTVAASDSTFLTSGDVMVPVNPGGNAAVFSTAPANFGAFDYAASLDLFAFPNAATATNARVFLSKYKTDNSPFDRMALTGAHGTFIATGVAWTAVGAFEPHGSNEVWVEGGLMYVNGASTTTGYCCAVPIAADWEYASAQNGRVILPVMSLADCDKVIRADVSEAQAIGNMTGHNIGPATNPCRLLYRTTGIADNSGSWTLIDQSGDLNIAGVSQIQFAVEYRTIGISANASRTFAVTVTYDDTNTNSRYQFSANKSDATNKRFAWRHATAFGSSVPALRVRLFDAVTGSSLVDDNTSSPSGTFERSTDGTNWSAWTNADKGNETTYVRYTPASIADNVQVRAVLTLL